MQCQWLHALLLLYILKVVFEKWVALHNRLQQSDVSQVLNWGGLEFFFATGHGFLNLHPVI